MSNSGPSGERDGWFIADDVHIATVEATDHTRPIPAHHLLLICESFLSLSVSLCLCLSLPLSLSLSLSLSLFLFLSLWYATLDTCYPQARGFHEISVMLSLLVILIFVFSVIAHYVFSNVRLVI